MHIPLFQPKKKTKLPPSIKKKDWFDPEKNFNRINQSYKYLLYVELICFYCFGEMTDDEEKKKREHAKSISRFPWKISMGSSSTISGRDEGGDLRVMS